jgi:hypothetical protein
MNYYYRCMEVLAYLLYTAVFIKGIWGAVCKSLRKWVVVVLFSMVTFAAFTYACEATCAFGTDIPWSVLRHINLLALFLLLVSTKGTLGGRN